MDDTSDFHATKFINILASYGIIQHNDVNTPTHIRGHCLDGVFSLDSLKLVDIVVDAPGLISDHSLITFNLPAVKTAVISVLRQMRNWRKFELDKFVMDLSNSVLCSTVTYNSLDVCNLVTSYNSVLSDLIDMHAPLITINVSERAHNAPWFDDECRSNRSQVRRFERHYRSSKTEALKLDCFNQWSAAFKLLHKLYKDKESAYWEAEISAHAHDSSKLWSVISSILHRNVPSSVPKVLDAQVISDFFVDKISALRVSFPEVFTTSYPSRSTPLVAPPH